MDGVGLSVVRWARPAKSLRRSRHWRDPTVERIIGMARRPFDPTAHGWSRTEYLQGDIPRRRRRTGRRR